MGGIDPGTGLHRLGVFQAAEALREGRLSAEELVSACLARIDAVEPQVQAWVYLDREWALDSARRADEARKRGEPLGRLHGVPVGLKDIIDCCGMPTEDGTPLHAGRVAMFDAALVRALKAAGAVILGKTVTTELATYTPGKTRHPQDSGRSPGGSSSGSAAAVAAFMVPGAVGTQTNGSVIRPAAYCGVYGFKPSFGLIPRSGVLQQSRPLDQIGVFGRSLEDVALLAEALVGYDEEDPDTVPRPVPPLVKLCGEEPPLPPKIAFVKTPFWELAEAETREAFAELVEHLGEDVEEFKLPELFAEAWDWHRTLMEADIAKSFQREYKQGRDQLSESLRGQIERGRRVLAVDYNLALERRRAVRKGLDELFAQRYSAILTPATTGTAPPPETTGDPVFCTLWTYCGMPALSLPLMQGADGLPLGVQLVGQYGDDARLLRTARWLERRVNEAGE